MSQYSVYSDAYAVADRPTFIRKTYIHVAGALGGLVALEALLLNSPLAPALTALMLGSRISWLVAFGLFMFATHIAGKWASSSETRNGQYAGLALYVVAEAIILCPLLVIASSMSAGLIPKAGLITLGVFIGLTWIAFTSKKDFSFLGGFLKIACMVALVTIVAGLVFGFSFGVWFIGAMLLLVGAIILYQTSNVIHHYHTNQYVAASLALFSSITTLFWYVLQLLMSSRD
ncbi:MAG: permease [Verrucomicrobiaceae bacterium]|nr:MAG: permease [Verrucomicrobiaceae bacterium]